MQGLADGYFILPYTIGDYLANNKFDKVDASHPAAKDSENGVHRLTNRLLEIRGKRTVTSFHRELGKLLWDDCGMARTQASLKTVLDGVPKLREEFWSSVNVLGDGEELNQALENAGRVADFLEFAELMGLDALHRNESCGGHFREEFQTPDGEALRNDEQFSYVAAWEYAGPGKQPILNKEPLNFDYVHPSQRSYK